MIIWREKLLTYAWRAVNWWRSDDIHDVAHSCGDASWRHWSLTIWFWYAQCLRNNLLFTQITHESIVFHWANIYGASSQTKSEQKFHSLLGKFLHLKLANLCSKNVDKSTVENGLALTWGNSPERADSGNAKPKAIIRRCWSASE